MIDCGILADGNSYWWPSVHYMQERFGLLALTNLDEDHAEDFRSVMQYSPPRLILSNPTIGYAELIKLKKDGMRDGVDAVAQWMARPKGTPIPLPEPDFGPIAVRWYYNRYLPGLSRTRTTSAWLSSCNMANSKSYFRVTWSSQAGGICFVFLLSGPIFWG